MNPENSVNPENPDSDKKKSEFGFVRFMDYWILKFESLNPLIP
jgi:hypothetical protein